MPEIDPELAELFYEETNERLARIEDAITELRCSNSPDSVADLGRELHSVKGALSMLGVNTLVTFVHDLESLVPLTSESPGCLDLLAEARDWLATNASSLVGSAANGHPDELHGRITKALSSQRGDPLESTLELTWVKDIRALLNQPRRAKGRTDASPTRDDFVQVPSQKLDVLEKLVSDLLDAQPRYELQLQRSRDLWTRCRSVPELRDDARAIHQGLHDDRAQLAKITKDLEQLAVELQQRPIADLFEQLVHNGQELARLSAKPVQFEVRGEQTKLDRVVIKGLRDPLVHLLRNVIDHGTQLEEERVADGKSPVNTIVLSAERDGVSVIIRLSDDGPGVDLARLTELAQEHGLLSAEELAELRPEELVNLVFLPGLSTRSTVTQTSGRGLGLDVVRRGIEALKGEVRLHSSKGQGTVTEARVPVSLLVSRVLLVRAGASGIFAIPTEALERTDSLALPMTARPPSSYQLRGQSLPLVSLARWLECPPSKRPESRVVVVRHQDDVLALTIDDFVGERSVVIKPLGWPVEHLPSISGAIQLATGELALALHVPELVSTAQRTRRSTVTQISRRRLTFPGRTRTPARVLIVDDSSLVRERLTRIVESLGYLAESASDGLEALARTRANQPDLLLTDVDMPRLDGLALARRLRSSKATNKIPIIMLSARDSPVDRRRGLAAGADVYLSKSVRADGDLSTLLGPQLQRLAQHGRKRPSDPS